MQLCSLSMLHYFRNITASNIPDRKQHVDHVDKEIGFSYFLPQSVIATAKPKNLKKMIHASYKKLHHLSDIEYITRSVQWINHYHFLAILLQFDMGCSCLILIFLDPLSQFTLIYSLASVQ